MAGANYKCVIKSCKRSLSQSTTECPVKLFSFPSHSQMLIEWLRILNMDIKVVNKSTRICDRHFETKYLNQSTLKPDAIPTLNLSEKTALDLQNTALNNIQIDLCNNCPQMEEEEAYYKKQWLDTLAELKKKEESLANIKKRIRSTHKTISNREKFKPKEMCWERTKKIIANMPHISESSKIICTMFLKKQRNYSPEETIIAHNINYHSPRTYLYLRDVLKLNLPSMNTLLRLKRKKHAP